MKSTSQPPGAKARPDGTSRTSSLLRFCLLLVLLLAVTSCGRQPVEFGVLEGHVTIGPLTPVVQEGESPPTPSVETYAARQIVVYEGDGSTEVARLQIDAAGNYRGELPVGTYVIDINRVGIDFAKDLPVEVEITAGSTVRLDIDIDTGIR